MVNRGYFQARGTRARYPKLGLSALTIPLNESFDHKSFFLDLISRFLVPIGVNLVWDISLSKKKISEHKIFLFAKGSSMSAFVWSQKEKGGKRSGKKSTNQILGLSSFSQTGVGGDNHITHPTSYGWGHFQKFFQTKNLIKVHY